MSFEQLALAATSWDSEAAIYSDTDSHETASEEVEDVSWKTSAKFWTPATWARFDELLLDSGYELCAQGFSPKRTYLEDKTSYLQERALVTLDDLYPFDNLRRARSLYIDHAQPLYIRAVVPSEASNEIGVLALLASPISQSNRNNIVCPTLDIIKHTEDEVVIYFIVHLYAGEPCFTFPFHDDYHWKKFVLDCFEGLNFLHSLGIAHLDIGPMNVLYDAEKCRPAFIDFEGCQVTNLQGRAIDSFTHKEKIGFWEPPLAVNARLPELGKPFDPFAADCWMLGDTLLQLRKFPDDDITTLLRFMSIKEPRARPTIRYALERLKEILEAEIE